MLLRRLDPDATELKDTIARVARLVLEREREAGLAERVRQEDKKECTLSLCVYSTAVQRRA